MYFISKWLLIVHTRFYYKVQIILPYGNILVLKYYVLVCPLPTLSCYHSSGSCLTTLVYHMVIYAS